MKHFYLPLDTSLMKVRELEEIGKETTEHSLDRIIQRNSQTKLSKQKTILT